MSESGATRNNDIEVVWKNELNFEDYKVKDVVAIGINTYTDWSSLNNAVRGAKAIGTLLRDIYGFNLQFYENVDRDTFESIIDNIPEKFGRNMGKIEEKSLLIFIFSGHGHKDGFMIPRNGAQNGHTRCINYDDLCKRLKVLGYQHYLLLLDCCYSGVIRTTRDMIERLIIPADQVRINFKPTAEALAAGAADEKVYDGIPGGHSHFADAVLQVLKVDLKPGYAILPQSIASVTQTRVLTLTNGQVTPTYTNILPSNLGGYREGRIVIFRKGFRITTNSLPQVTLGLAYNKQLEAVGGTEPYTWSVIGLPQGLTLNNIGIIMGVSKQVGSFTLCIQVKDNEGRTATRDLNLMVLGESREKPLKILTDALQPGFAGQQYKMELFCTGGVPPYQWTTDPLPEGLELAATGQYRAEIVRTPLSVGCYRINIAVTDSAGSIVEFPWPISLPVLSKEDYCVVPAGRFNMGYQPSEQRNTYIDELANKYFDFPSRSQLGREYPPCEVEVRAFAIRKYPVMNREYLKFLKATRFETPLPLTWRGDQNDSYFPEDKADHPVVGISHDDAVKYCRWRGTRLPTAVEWEKGARGTDGQLYPWGNEFHKTSCNTAESEVGQALPVGDVPGDKSPYSVCDMAGNVAEWVDSGMAFKIKADGRTYYGIQRHVRGASFLDLGILYGMCIMKSKESFATEILQPDNGAKLDFEIEKPQADWIGFRDCVDLNTTIVSEQKLVNIRGGRVFGEGRRPTEASSPFSIARFAVSNLEYLEFVLNTGHGRPAHWAETNPPFPYEQRHWPVVNVSQADAQAFCRWKSKILGRRCRLPSAIHWELAAGGLKGWRYPWGNEFEAWRCNSPESGWGRPVNVFDLPEGATPEGVYNLCGNVFEWLLSNEDSRGGSWRWEQSCEHAGTRWVNTKNLNKFDSDTGFRYISEPVRDNKRTNEYA